MDGYGYLAIAIVEQAAKDYRKKIKKYGKAPDIVRFFHSDWGNLCCFGKADLILEKLKDECVKGKKLKGKPKGKRGMVPMKRKASKKYVSSQKM